MAAWSRDRISKEAGDFLTAWLLISAALVPAVLLGDLVLVILAMVVETGNIGHHWSGLRDWIEMLLLVAALSVPFMLLFAVLAAPLVVFRRWIVRLHFPFVRAGYLAVAGYGPLLLVLNGWYGYAMWVTMYEVVALAATLLFVPAGRPTALWLKSARHPPQSFGESGYGVGGALRP